MPLGLLGKYERLDVLGHGASGIVYLAKDTLLNKQVALKEVDVQAGDMRRFLEEARVMDRLRHPNIVRVNGVDRIDGKIVIDMEYVRGQNLQSLLRQEGPLPLNRALDIVAQTLDALDYAHSMQTVHRDIKPANILIGRDGLVKLVDFGLAEILSTNAYAGGAGTYAYMAPEDFAEEDRSDRQSDIWAVGVTLYEMLTSQRPFLVTKVKDPFAWKRALETQLPTPITDYLPEAPRELQRILDRALARDKRLRYPSAGDFRDDLIRLRRGQALAPDPIPFPFDMGSASTRPVAFDDCDGILPETTRERSGSPAFDFETQTVPGKKEGRGKGEDVETTRPSAPSFRNTPLPDAENRSAKRETPGTVVADVNPVKNGRRRLSFRNRQATAKLIVEPESIDFGSARKGQTRQMRLQTRVLNAEGPIAGQIARTPAWITAYPPAFDRARQVITLTAHSERTWETGDFSDIVQIETSAGIVEVPVRLRVLWPRSTFRQIAVWYVPLFLAMLAPVLAIAFGSAQASAPRIVMMVPSAAMATGLMALLLLLIGIAADVGLGERIACGVLAAVMCFVLGAAEANYHTTHALYLAESMNRAWLVGGIMGLTLLLQLLNLSRWRLWGVILACLGVFWGGWMLNMLHS